MVPYVVILIFSFLFVLLQNIFLERLIPYPLPLDLPLLLVLYASWQWENVRGMFLALILGIFVDWIYSPFYGLYSVTYLSIFLVAIALEVVLSDHAYGKYYLVLLAIMLKTAIMALLCLEIFTTAEVLSTLIVYGLQALILCLVVTPFFRLIAGVEKRLHSAPQ
ncbi:MAG: hypothetical protein K9K75_02520 [Deltaproteobacteria bacterium]|nr:hypothetical protein [Deltaproteobacteria bacterium]